MAAAPGAPALLALLRGKQQRLPLPCQPAPPASPNPHPAGGAGLQVWAGSGGLQAQAAVRPEDMAA